MKSRRPSPLSAGLGLLLLCAFGLGPALGPLAIPQAEARRSYPKIKVPGELRAELNAVLKAAADLHEASFKGQDGPRLVALKTLMARIDSAMKKSHLAKEQRTHVMKYLGAARNALESSRRASGRDRQTFLQKAFKQISLIAQTYQLDNYKVFFCERDKSQWLQRGAKPQNPINPSTYGKCGKLVSS